VQHGRRRDTARGEGTAPALQPVPCGEPPLRAGEVVDRRVPEVQQMLGGRPGEELAPTPLVMVRAPPKTAGAPSTRTGTSTLRETGPSSIGSDPPDVGVDATGGAPVGVTAGPGPRRWPPRIRSAGSG
jgi:hypothetical protein